MNTKDFETLARTIAIAIYRMDRYEAEEKAEVLLVDTLCDELGRNYPRFNEKKFRAGCGVENV
jgi:hypothetical protein